MIRILLLGLIVSVVSGCNTVAGAGKDISSSADWVKSKVSGSPSQKAAPAAAKPDPTAPAAQPAAPAQPAPAQTPAPSPAPAQTRT